MFTTQCFIEKSTKVCDWLSELGYEQFNLTGGDAIFSMHKGYDRAWFSDCPMCEIEKEKSDFVDCRENFPMFKALTALRDDSDANQWFTDGTTWLKASEVTVNDNPIKDYSDLFKGLHKATKEELINHFKK